MSYEELAEIYSALDNPDKIQTLSMTSEFEPATIASELGSSKETVSSYMESFEEAGLVEYTSNGYSITERGKTLLPGNSEALKEPIVAIDSELDEFWPAFAYATCNNPGEPNSSSISLYEIADQTERFEKPTEVSELLKKAKREGYISHKGKGDWEITGKGAEILNNGFDTSEVDLGCSEFDAEGLIDSIVSRYLEKKASIGDRLGIEEDKGLIEELENGKYRITEKGINESIKAFDWDERNIMYQTGEWTELVDNIEDRIDNIEDRLGEEKRLEIVTVNEENIILEGGHALDVDRIDTFNKGEELTVETTGTTTRYGEFEKVELVD